MKCIDFTLEIANGCQFSCSGCNIDKEGNSWPTDNDFKSLMALMDDFIAHGCFMRNITIGPTDIMTSYNRDKLFASKEIKEIITKFNKVTFNLAFLNPITENYEKLAEQIDWLAEGNNVSFVIPFELAHIDNNNYLNRIAKRVSIVGDNFKKSKYYKSNLLINYDPDEVYDKDNGTNMTDSLFLKFFEKEKLIHFDSINIALSVTRRDLRDSTNSTKFLKSVLSLKSVVRKSVEKFRNIINISEGNLVEGKDWDLVYKSGRLYMTPFILEGIASFDDIFLVTEEWSMFGLYNCYNRNIVNQLNWTDNTDSCGKCNLAGICAERGVHNLMKITGITECISPAKELEKFI